MKRYGNLYEQVCTEDNMVLAYEKSRKGKAHTYGVKLFEKDLENNMRQLNRELTTGTYRTSEYSVFTIYDPKEREIYRLPFRDRVVHHAIMNVMEPIWTNIFILKVKYEDRECKFFTNATPIKQALDQINKADFPFKTVIKQQRFGSGSGKTFYFT